MHQYPQKLLKPKFHAMLACVVSVFCGQEEAQATEYWRVSEQQAKCLLENKESYLHTGGSPILIVVSACPETDIVKAMQFVSRNSALPGSKAKQSELDDVVVYSRDELICLSSSMIVSVQGEVRLPANPAC
jgi:hypothetical protein